MSLRLRSAVANDTDLIFNFIRQLAEYEKLLGEVTATPELLQARLFGETPYAKVIIAEWEGESAGFALYFYNFSTFVGKQGIYLEDLFISPEFRGKGIGKALLMDLARIATAEDCGRIDWSVLDWNSPSIEFYKSLGAVSLDDWTGFRLSRPAFENLLNGN